jgi:uncharacterized protein YlaI
MKHKVKCAVCGRAGVVEIDDKTREIRSEWLRMDTLAAKGESEN